MEKTIVFTVSSNRMEKGITIRANNLLADEEDREINRLYSHLLLCEMRDLSKKYNDRGIAVLFDCE